MMLKDYDFYRDWSVEKKLSLIYGSAEAIECLWLSTHCQQERMPLFSAIASDQ